MIQKKILFILIFFFIIQTGISTVYASEADSLIVVKPFGPSVKNPDPAKGSNGWFFSEAGVTETLFALDFDMKIIPWLAVSYKNINPLTWEISLKKDVHFHDNSIMDPSEVKSSIERLIHEKSPAFNKRMQVLLDIKSIKIKDDYTLVFETVRPNASFLYNLTAPEAGIIKTDKKGKIFATGPFMVKKTVPKNNMIVTRFDKYWGGRPDLAQADLKIIKNPATRMLAFESGQADIAVNFPEYDAVRIQNQKNIKIFHTPTARVCFFFVRTADGPLADITIRKAVNYALDRKEIVDALLAGIGGKIGASVFPEILPWSNQNLKPFVCDPEKALNLMKEAGAKDSDGDGILELNGKPLVLNMWTYEGRASLKPALELVQVQLKRVGIATKLKVTKKGSPINEAMEKGQVHLNLQMWNAAPQGDPDFFISSIITSDAGSNFMGYSNKELDTLAEKGRQCFEPAERKKIYDRIQEIIYDECPVIVLFYKSMISAVSTKVENYRIHPAEKYILNPKIIKKK